MAKKPKNSPSLRRRAEKEPPQKEKQGSLSDMGELIHEMEVHQIELEMQNEELMLSRDRYAELYDYSPTAYFDVDTYSGLIREMNLAAAELLRTTRTLACKSRFTGFIDPEYADIFHVCSRKSMVGSRRETCEIKMRRSDGSAFWALLDLRGEPENKQIRIAATDITERKQAEQIKDDFIAMVSHELRTPLTIIMGCIKVAQSPGIDREQQDELLREASRSSDALSTILDNLIELSRYQSDRLNLNRTCVNIETTIREIISSEIGHGNEHRFLLSIARDLPEVEVDVTRLRQIMRNLLDNAAKYSPLDTEIRVSATQQKKDILIGVSDQGKGISPEDQARLFQPFERLEKKSTTRPGMGLGLLVCKRLVEAHGGRIWIESAPGQGSTFWFTLPLQS
jgi:PAS domain S-box-containing protein